MQLHVEPDLAIPMPTEAVNLIEFRERAIAACESASLLGLEDVATEENLEEAEKIVYEVAEGDPKALKKLNKQASQLQPATYGLVKELLDEFAIKIVDNAVQIRLLVTNKLLLETTNPDPRVRIRALELLGKISDVGLFTERSEVTINHRSTQELTASLREKIRRLMMPEEDIVEAKIIESHGEEVDLDKELGLEEESTPQEVENDG